MDRIRFIHTYEHIISLENLLAAWQEFLSGKKMRKDVQEFERNLMGNIVSLHTEFAARTYQHSAYHAFNISDPKPRNIHKATVRDRLVHHALYRVLYPYFDTKFICDSYSCRTGKGTHRAIDRFRDFSRTVSKNDTKTCWVLKCDIRKFFASIDHEILKNILAKNIKDEDTLWLLGNIIDSFPRIYATRQNDLVGLVAEMENVRHSVFNKRGLPLGNLTSQLLVNIYMNEFDQFAKHTLKAKYYIRYADDFVILSEDKDSLESLLPKIADFLEKRLKLSLHPDKVFIRTLAS